MPHSFKRQKGRAPPEMHWLISRPVEIHVTAVRGQDRRHLYPDGYQVVQSDALSVGCYNLDPAVPFYIGYGSVDYFSGDMEEMRIYNRALTAEDVATLAQ